MSASASPEVSSSTAREALRNARTVVIVVHGVGDPDAADMIGEAEAGARSLWQEKATTTRIKIPDLPLPKDVDFLAWRRHEPAEALQVSVDAEKHIILPIIWSGLRERAGRYAARGRGFTGFTLALPMLLGTCVNLLRCVPRADGLWIAGVLLVAILCSLVIAGFIAFMWYVITKLPWWLGAPFYNHWYQEVLAIGSWVLMGSVITRASVVFDLLGDVAYYVTEKQKRSQNIEKMAGLIALIAESAPDSSILVVGHSLGSVLVSHAAAHLPESYSGKGRTVLLTMGSPLKLMSRVFPRHVQSPDSLLTIYRRSGLIVKWINLWRTKDMIGRALRPQNIEGFDEAPLGIGGHGNYWSDERVWIAVAEIMRNLPSGNLGGIENIWQSLPLSSAEEKQLVQLWDGWRLAKNVCWSLVFFSVAMQFKFIVPWQRQLPIWQHALIAVAWNAGLWALGFGTYLLWKPPSYKSARDFFHYLAFTATEARAFLVFGLADLGIISTICSVRH